MDLLLFATAQNYFWFNSKFYIQTTGIAMGAKFAPSLVSLFIAKWEENVAYAHGRSHCLLCVKYIDDILLWKGGQLSLDSYDRINS